MGGTPRQGQMVHHHRCGQCLRRVLAQAVGLQAPPCHRWRVSPRPLFLSSSDTAQDAGMGLGQAAAEELDAETLPWPSPWLPPGTGFEIPDAGEEMPRVK